MHVTHMKFGMKYLLHKRHVSMHVTHMKFSMHEENKSLWYEYEFTQKKTSSWVSYINNTSTENELAQRSQINTWTNRTDSPSNNYLSTNATVLHFINCTGIRLQMPPISKILLYQTVNGLPNVVFWGWYLKQDKETSTFALLCSSQITHYPNWQ